MLGLINCICSASESNQQTRLCSAGVIIFPGLHRLKDFQLKLFLSFRVFKLPFNHGELLVVLDTDCVRKEENGRGKMVKKLSK